MKRLWPIAVAASGLCAGAAYAQSAPPPAEASPPPGYVLPDTQTWDLSAEDGQVYKIFVSLPKGEPPKAGYPVLYVLDGNAMFAGFAEARRIQDGGPGDGFGQPGIGRSIVIGVGYPTDFAYDVRRRLYDFTPPWPGGKVPPEAAQLAKYEVGGNDRFADFLLRRLRPEIARRYAIDPDRQALFGHSLGGLFALHMLYTHPGAFHAIVAASPSQWWNQQGNLAEERAFGTGLAQGKIAGPVSNLLLLVGAQEDRITNRWDAESLAKRLEPLSAYGLRTRFEVFEDERHISVPHRAITTALRFAFVWP